jgi:hypothetical protein
VPEVEQPLHLSPQTYKIELVLNKRVTRKPANGDEPEAMRDKLIVQRAAVIIYSHEIYCETRDFCHEHSS